jgi:hypothetical protein
MGLSKKETERQEKLYGWAKWRWEFARRNPKVKEAYNLALKLRKKASHSPEIERKMGIFIDYPYLSTPEGKQEKEMCEELGLLSSCLINPNKSFDEIVHGPYCMEKDSFLPETFWSRYATRKIEGSHLILDIDLTKVRSLRALKSEIGELLSLVHEEYYKKYIKEHYSPETKERRLIDYDVILTVGDLIVNEGLTYKEVAKRVIPQDYKRNPESAERNIGIYNDRYKELVKSRYRDLTYP